MMTEKTDLLREIRGKSRQNLEKLERTKEGDFLLFRDKILFFVGKEKN